MGTKKDAREVKISGILKTIEQLRARLKEFERMKKEMQTATITAVKLIPILEDEKSRLQDDLERTKDKIAQVADLIRNLETEERRIEEDIRLDEDRISHIDDQIKALTRMMNLELPG